MRAAARSPPSSGGQTAQGGLGGGPCAPLPVPAALLPAHSRLFYLRAVLAAGYEDGYLVLYSAESGKVLHRASMCSGAAITALTWTAVRPRRAPAGDALVFFFFAWSATPALPPTVARSLSPVAATGGDQPVAGGRQGRHADPTALKRRRPAPHGSRQGHVPSCRWRR